MQADAGRQALILPARGPAAARGRRPPSAPARVVQVPMPQMKFAPK